MTLSQADSDELLLPLFGGITESPLWETFLAKLAKRATADRVHLIVRHCSAAPPSPLRRRFAASPEDRLTATAGNLVDLEIAALGSLPWGALRPGRVYSLDELRELPGSPAWCLQTDALRDAQIGDARLIRMTGSGGYMVWLILLHRRRAFTAAEGALLSGLAPAMEGAVANLTAITELRLRATTAEDSLALLGIGQATLDRAGQVVACDPLWRRTYARRSPNQRRPDPGLVAACVGLAEAGPEARRIVRDHDGDGTPILLRGAAPHTDLPDATAAVATFRRPRRSWVGSAGAVLAASLGLSQREAMLAAHMSLGVPLIDAGRQLKLTPHTTRNYSKRIYAKVGAAGQADLVRIVLTGLAPLA